MKYHNLLKVLSFSFLLFLFFSVFSLSSFCQAKEVRKTILWQREAKGGVDNLFLLSDPESQDLHLIVQALGTIYSLDPYSGEVEWKVTPPPYGKYLLNTLPDSCLEDIDQDHIPELIVASNFYYSDYDTVGGLYVYDPFTGALEHSFYYGNFTSDVRTGVFKPCKGKGIVMVGEYYFPDDYPLRCQYLLILDSTTFEPVFNDSSLGNDYIDNSGAICEPFIFDLTGDGYDELILSIGNFTTHPTGNSTVVVLDGSNFKVLWRQYLPAQVFQASDIEYYDFTGDGIKDLLLTESGSLCLLDGKNGTILWFNKDYGHEDSTLADIDHDNETEVIATCLEDLAILDGRIGTVEINKTLPFLFDGGNLAVVDLANNGSEYILSNSFYGNLYLFSPTFDLVDILHTPGGWVKELLLYDLTGDGTLEIIGGCFGSVVFAYIYVGVLPSSFSPFILFLIVTVLILFVLVLMLFLKFIPRLSS